RNCGTRVTRARALGRPWAAAVSRSPIARHGQRRLPRRRDHVHRRRRMNEQAKPTTDGEGSAISEPRWNGTLLSQLPVYADPDKAYEARRAGLLPPDADADERALRERRRKAEVAAAARAERDRAVRARRGQ